jgi:DNA-binding GntR family transcriptional regulator
MPRKQRSLMEQAYTELKRRIITLDLKPGQRLDDYELSLELSFSRTPVREAIFLLGAEGWVDIRSKAGFIVRPLDLVDIAHLFEAHIVLAKAVARFAAARVTAAELKAMRETLAEVEAAIKRRDYLAITAANARLHRLEGAATHNDILKGMAESVHDQGQRLAYLCFGGAGARSDLAQHFETVTAQHRAMVSALEAGDHRAAEEIAVQHVRLFRKRVQDYVASEIEFELSDEDLAGIAAPEAVEKNGGKGRASAGAKTRRAQSRQPSASPRSRGRSSS